ncbi:GNAT family N-acetyltransferase [Qipengyuania sp. DGS5-3]|uniref:GNAT family N-acetyltransferase n=1 Tax=Qipengyuania sp. DGS5-3 TaxID=3349632 RepID=UPI0036D337C5
MMQRDNIDRAMAIMETAFDPQWGEAWNRRQLEASLAVPGTHLLLANQAGGIAELDEEAVGFTLSRSVAGEEELLLIAVVPEYRNRGIGSSILSLFLKQATSRGIGVIFLEMRANNTAKSLYKKYGFVPIGRRKDYYKTAEGSRLDAITFSLTI